MKVDLGKLAVNLGRKEIVFVPVLLAWGIKVASHTSWQPTVMLWGFALVPIAGGVALLERASRRHVSRLGRPVRAGEIESEVETIFYGYGLLVLAEFVFVGAMDWRIAFALLGIAAIWLLIGAPLRYRRIETTNSVDVDCSPQTAFDFISDPHHWHLFAPEIELRQEVPVPVQVGTVIPCRNRMSSGLLLDVDEVVLELEPSRRFTTGILGTPKPTSGEYIFESFGGTTRIAYTYRSRLTMAEAALQGPVSRPKLIQAMNLRRIDILRRIKELLEHPKAATV